MIALTYFYIRFYGQDLFPDSQTSGSEDDLLDETPSSPLEEVLAPSLLAMNLKFDSAPADDMYVFYLLIVSLCNVFFR